MKFISATLAVLAVLPAASAVNLKGYIKVENIAPVDGTFQTPCKLTGIFLFFRLMLVFAVADIDCCCYIPCQCGSLSTTEASTATTALPP